MATIEPQALEQDLRIGQSRGRARSANAGAREVDQTAQQRPGPGSRDA